MAAKDAALVNGVFAHADESDDSHDESRTHPGASVVPAALAVAQERGVSRDDFLLSVARGYEACAAISMLAWESSSDRRLAHSSPTSIGGTWGAAFAAAHLLGVNKRGYTDVAAFAAQFSSGNGAWLRDRLHLEKAVVFGGMPAHNGVIVATLVKAGWVGVSDPLDMSPSLFTSLGLRAPQHRLSEVLGDDAVVCQTAVKKYCVGSPIQAAVEAAIELVSRGTRASEIVAVEIELPAPLAKIVDQRQMHDVNVQYLVARSLATGDCSFGDLHFRGNRPNPPELERLLSVTTLIPSASMEVKRQARVCVRLSGGTCIESYVFPVRGSRENPMTRTEVEEKAEQLLREVADLPAVMQLIGAFQDRDSNLVEETTRFLSLTRRSD